MTGWGVVVAGGVGGDMPVGGSSRKKKQVRDWFQELSQYSVMPEKE